MFFVITFLRNIFQTFGLYLFYNPNVFRYRFNSFRQLLKVKKTISIKNAP